MYLLEKKKLSTMRNLFTLLFFQYQTVDSQDFHDPTAVVRKYWDILNISEQKCNGLYPEITEVNQIN